MPGLTVEVDAQLKIDNVVTGSKFSSSLDRVLDDVQKQAESRKIVPFSMKELQKMSSVISKTVLSATGGEVKIPYNLVLDTMKEKNKAFALAGEIQKAMAIKGIEMSDEGAIKQAMGILDTLKKKRTSDIKDVAKLNEETFLAYERLELREKKKTLDYIKQRNKELIKEMSADLASGKSEMKGGYTPTTGAPIEVVKSTGWASKLLPPKPVAPGMGATLGKPAAPPAAGGALGAGAVAGGVAAGIMLLAEAIQGMIKQSKIASMVTDTFNKAMGLLIDLILIPFIPLLVWGIINLFKIILWAGGIWKTFWNLPAVKALQEAFVNLALKFGEGLKLAMDLIVTAVGDVWEILQKALKGDPLSIAIMLVLSAGALAVLAELAPWIAGTVVGSMVITAALAALGALEMWILGLFAISPLVAWAVMIGIGVIVGETIVLLLNVLGILQAISDLGKTFRENSASWFDQMPPALQYVITFLHNGIRLLGEFFNLFNRLLGLPEILTPEAMSRIISAGVYNKDVMKSLRDKYGDVSYSASGGYTMAGGKFRLDQYATGGIIPGIPNSPQLVLAHGGERILPTGSRDGGSSTTNNESMQNNTFNFYGYQDDKFISKVKEILRQQGAGYHL